MVFRSAVVAVTLLAFTGCTTLQTFNDAKPTPASIRQELQVGDEVHLVTDGNVPYDLHVNEMEADAFLGQDAAGKSYRVHYAAIKSLSIARERQTAVGAIGHALAVVGAGIVIAYGVMCAILLWSFSKLDD